MKKLLPFLSAGLCSSASATLVFVPIDITGGTASQSTSHPAGPAGNAINGNLSDFTHTNGGDPNPEWNVDFGSDQTFNRVILHNRDDCCQNRLSDVSMALYNSTSTEVYNSGTVNPGNSLGNPAFIALDFPTTTARSLSVFRDGSSTVGTQGILSLGEVQIGNVSDLILGPGTNLTQANLFGMTVSQTPTSASPPGGGVAGNAVNGNFGDFTHTNANISVNHSLTLDLASMLSLESIMIANRDNCCGERLRDITVRVLDDLGGEVFNSGLLNPGNALGFSGSGSGGLDLDLIALTGGRVDGQIVEITRTTDAVGPNNDDRSVLSIGELTVLGGTIPEPSTGLLSLIGLGLALRRRR